ncbi:MAG: helix-turn-helix transcriptional regulator [Methylocella sp.]
MLYRSRPLPAGVVRLMLGDGQMNTKANSSLLDAKKAADWAGLSASTLAKLRLTGSGPAYVKLGRRVVYRIDDLDAWIQANRHKSTSEYGAKTG